MTTLVTDACGRVVQALFQGVVQNVAYTGTAAQSARLGSDTQIVQVVADSDCYYLVGDTNVVATTANGSRIPANVILFIGVNPGSYISFIQSSANGTANITEGK